MVPHCLQVGGETVESCSAFLVKPVRKPLFSELRDLIGVIQDWMCGDLVAYSTGDSYTLTPP